MRVLNFRIATLVLSVLTLLSVTFTNKAFADGTESSVLYTLYDDAIIFQGSVQFYDFIYDSKNASNDKAFDVTNDFYKGTKSRHVTFTGGGYAEWSLETGADLNVSSIGASGYLMFYIKAPVLTDSGNTALNIGLASKGKSVWATDISLDSYITPGQNWQRVLIPLASVTQANSSFDWSKFSKMNIKTANKADFYIDQICFVNIKTPTAVELDGNRIDWAASTTTTNTSDECGGVSKYNIYRDNQTIAIASVPVSGLDTYFFIDSISGSHSYAVEAETTTGIKSTKVPTTVPANTDGNVSSMKTAIYDDSFYTEYFDELNTTNNSVIDAISPVFHGTKSRNIIFNGGYSTYTIKTNNPTDAGAIADTGYLVLSIFTPKHADFYGNQQMVLWLANDWSKWSKDAIQFDSYITSQTTWNKVLIPMKSVQQSDGAFNWSRFNILNIVSNNPANFYIDMVGFLNVAPPVKLMQIENGIKWRASETTTDINDMSGGVTGYEVFRDNEKIATVSVNGTGAYSYSDTGASLGQHTYDVYAVTRSGAKSSAATLKVTLSNASSRIFMYSGTSGTSPVTTLTAGATIRVMTDINNPTDSPKDLVLVSVLKKPDGSIYKMQTKMLTVPAQAVSFGSAAGQYITMTLPSVNLAGYKIQAFLWKNLNVLEPACDDIYVP